TAADPAVAPVTAEGVVVAALDETEAPPALRALAVLSEPSELPAPLALDTGAQMRVVIEAAGARWGADGPLLIRIAECESRLNPTVVGRNGAAGLFQIIPDTWRWAADRLSLGSASPFDPLANAEVAAWLLVTAGPGQWGCP
ncbi:MAG TPA: transglycosylase SLT domain-containing protein, partial [Chloroflexota bacterium]|nr:transglycosylase SLT domain-containing protein [Chloroflexota bacterium]